jgi:hypothetical protein
MSCWEIAFIVSVIMFIVTDYKYKSYIDNNRSIIDVEI